MTGDSLSRRFLNTSKYIILWKKNSLRAIYMICAKFHAVKKFGHEFQSLATPGNVGITLCYMNCMCLNVFTHSFTRSYEV